MTFKEFMKEVGYDLMTTFWEDFSIADKYGIAGVKDTYKRAFDEWKGNAYVSASPLSSTWYWSSTESSQAVAWYVVFSSGLTGTGNKHIGDMVRTVIDFLKGLQ